MYYYVNRSGIIKKKKEGLFMRNKLNFDKQIEELSLKAAQLEKELKESKENNKKAIDNQLKTAEGDLVAFKEQVKNEADETKSHAYSELLKLQMTFNAKKDAFKESIEAIKYENAKEKAEREVERSAEYASFALDAAMYAIGEATIALLDTVSKELEYEEKFEQV